MADPVFIDINSNVSLNALPIVVTDMDALNNKIMNLFRCPIGSRFREPKFGTRLMQFVHEPCDEMTANDIEMDLFSALRTWVPEITLVESLCSVHAYENGTGFNVNISYYVPRLRNQGNLAFSALRN